MPQTRGALRASAPSESHPSVPSPTFESSSSTSMAVISPFRSLIGWSRLAGPSDRLGTVVVDNGSRTDGLAGRLTTTNWPVSVIRSEVNLGFAEACTLAMRDRNDIDFVALVNSDALVEPVWLEAPRGAGRPGRWSGEPEDPARVTLSLA